MNIPEEILIGYVDGELDAAEVARVEAAIAADPAVARRVQQHRILRERARTAFDSVLDEPVPGRLLEAARRAPATDLAHARAARGARRWSLPVWGALAASVVLGALIGAALMRDRIAAPVLSKEGQLVARGELDRALSTQLAAQNAPGRPVQMGVSFRDRDGTYCRAFRMREGGGVAGLACRQGEGWSVEILVRDAAAGSAGDHEMAGSLPAPVLEVIEQRIEGEALDAAREGEALRNDWQ